ncbi:two-component system response regulator YesN [Hydrogenispora ethanolica]|uniref:Two-component system response regulator YesN n=1 Tax=Hydrogenispora ethanolica TaxID=1082276 RepID=A0A4R1RZW4_HYDET|nr:helix-turn-helix domain-containing protein [Hydrogenispora ethanolica]TCL72358.1 two-component system response regulator YesN [Hydrogenispora ethanolica]
MMIKVMIVDDEFLVRVGMRSVLDWGYHGFELCGEAADGAEALNLCEKQQPDIILTDIKMPKMDGMELIRAVKTKYPWVHFIILTCLDELNLVKEALALGAAGYFTKISVNREEILQTLVGLRETIQQTRQKAAELANLKQLIASNRAVLKEQLFQSLMTAGRAGENAAMPEASPLWSCPEVYDRADLFLLVRLNRNQSIRDPQLFRQSVLDLLQEIIGRHRLCGEVFPAAETEFLIGAYERDDTVHEFAQLDALLQDIRESVQLYFNTSCLVVSTGKFHSFRELSEVFRQLQTELAELARATGKLHPSGRLDERLAGSISAGLKEGDNEKILIALEEVFAMATERGWQLEQLRKIGLQVMFGFEKELERYDQTIDVVFADDLIGQVMSCQEQTTLKTLLLKAALTVTGALVDLKANTFRQDVKRIIDFLELHYAEKINLDYVASLANMNSAYFSRLFKKECGLGFVEYLNRIRMEKAKQLLQNSAVKLLEIAEKVGFEDVNYFGKTFKRYTGMSPSEYREQFGVFLT